MMHRFLGADGARDPYTPFVGCCAATVEHYDLDLDYDVDDNGLEARATLSCRALHDTDRIVVRCDAPMPLQLDGEDLGDVEEVVFEAERDAVAVLV